MAWPALDDFQQAVLNPATSFADAELRVASPQVDKNGIPRPRSGTFATVFRLEAGGRRWAVRCFRGPQSERTQRYAQIQSHLQSTRLPYTVSFQFLEQGIRVFGTWYPIVKMEWLEAPSLDRWIRDHLGDPRALLKVAAQWVQMTHDIEAAGIAHGDLQHANVLVAGDQIRIIDYDGMFVPGLVGRGPIETGQPNYQHPLRGQADFGLYLDNFSEWVVYVSLVALARDPSLWSQLNAGDDCLLFRKSDFEAPERSAAFRTLEHSTDPDIRGLAQVFRSLLYFDVRSIPSLDGRVVPPDPAAAAPAKVSNVGSSWLEDHLPRPIAVAVPPAATAPVSPLVHAQPMHDATWVLDYLVSARPPSFAATAAPERVVGVSLTLGALVLGLNSTTPVAVRIAIGALALLVMLGFFYARYLRDPTVRERAKVLARLEGLGTAGAPIEEAIKDSDRLRADVQRHERERRELLVTERVTRRLSERHEIGTIEQRYAADFREMTERRSAINVEARSDQSRLNTGIGARLAAVTQELSTVDKGEQTEKSRALRELQDAHVGTALRAATIDRATIANVGVGLKYTLHARGIHSAAEVSPSRIANVPGFGSSRQAAVMTWRNGIERRARADGPHALHPTTLATIEAKYTARRAELSAEQASLRARYEIEQQASRTRIAQELGPLDAREAASRAKMAAEIALIRPRYMPVYEALDQREREFENDIARRLEEIHHGVQVRRKELFDLNWRRARNAREVHAYRELTFAYHLRRIVLGAH